MADALMKQIGYASMAMSVVHSALNHRLSRRRSTPRNAKRIVVGPSLLDPLDRRLP
jgi:hypothetical protein